MQKIVFYYVIDKYLTFFFIKILTNYVLHSKLLCNTYILDGGKDLKEFL